MAKKTVTKTSKKPTKKMFENECKDIVPYIIIAILTILVVLFATGMFYGVGCRCNKSETTCSAVAN